ncbi:MAG: outer membrane protein assembly factor BamD [Ichthyobacteriaceae bacterium]|nr:outer membrane protein assembly factor BamD [Ichthyobacteriaceae bacterium]
MFKKLRLYSIYAVIALSFVSCSEYEKVLKSNNVKDKYKLANELFEDESYTKAVKLYEQVAVSYRGTPDAENITYMTAESYYNLGDYLLAAYYYDRYVKSYPDNEKVEYAAYKKAYCYYLDSPRYTLDQSNTIKAIEEMQSFINKYNDSEKIEEANKNIRELSTKLELKDYEIALQYMKLENYKAANITFGNFINDFPDSELREDAYYNKFVSLFLYADNSYYSKQKERYTEAKTAYLLFKSRYPDSKNMKKADKYYEKVLKGIEKAS